MIMEKKKYYIVWNGPKSEGFITDDKQDAKRAKSGKTGTINSSLGSFFYDCYDHQKITIQEIEIEGE